MQTSEQTEKRYLEEEADEKKGSRPEECKLAGPDVIS